MPVLADNDVIMHGNPQRLGDVDDRLRHLDVGLRGRGIAGGVIVHEDYRGLEVRFGSSASVEPPYRHFRSTP